MNKDFGFSGILGGKQSTNPGSQFFLFLIFLFNKLMISFLMLLMQWDWIGFGDFADFYNWNRIKVRYCDGSSFTGDIEAVDPVIN